MGWRYQFILIGGISLAGALIRIFGMKMEESPTWLVSIGRREDAIAVLKEMARVNEVELDISPEIFEREDISNVEPQAPAAGGFTGLFASRKLARSMIGLILLWMCIGVA